jgi:hypothetical protein
MGSQQKVVKPQANFLQLTTRQRQMLADVSSTAAGDFKTQDVYATGYLAYLKVAIIGTFTTGAGATGTFDANFWPDNLVNRLTLKSNAGFEFYNTNGVFNRQVQKYHRLGFDPKLTINSDTGLPYSTTGAKGYFFQAPTGAVAASTAYPIAVQYLIPVVSHPDLRAGLLPLQNNATRLQLGIQFGLPIDWGITNAGASPTYSFTVKTQMEFFSLPSDPQAQPDTSFIHRIIQEDLQWTASGDFQYRVPVNGVILRLWELFNNAGVPEKFFTTAATPTTNRFNNVTLQYAATQNPEVYDYRHMLYQHRLDYMTDLNDGFFMFDFASGGGSIEMGVSARDAINTRRLTELKTIINTTTTPGANSLVQVVRQELQPRAA